MIIHLKLILNYNYLCMSEIANTCAHMVYNRYTFASFRHACFIDGAELFDPKFFSLSALEARLVLQRAGLDLCVAKMNL